MKNLYFTIFIVFLTINAFSQDEYTIVQEGEKAPDFTYEVNPEKTAKLSNLKGKIVWINFFATWCGPCRLELPHLQSEVFDKYKDNPDFELLILGREENWDTINKFKEDNNFTMPFYPDVNREVFSKYANQNIPRNFIVDKDGNIAVASVGYTETEFEELKLKLKELLE